MKKKLLVLLLVASLAVVAFAISASAATGTQITGSDCYYTLENGVLTITGTGDLPASYRIPAGATSLVIEEGVTSINATMAYNKTALQSVQIPASVTSIGNNAFNNCTGLTTVTIAEGSKITTIGNNAFKSAAITSIAFGDSLTSVGTSAFELCTALTDVSWGNSSVTIGQRAFRQCYKLATLSGEIASVPTYAFYQCRALGTVELADTVASIDASAFRECAALTTVNVPVSVTSVGASAFRNTGITAIDLSGVETIGETAFYNCTALKSAILGNALVTVPKYCFANSGLTSITLPDSVKTVTAFAFYGCKSLATADLGSITSLGGQVFAASGIQTISIPGTLPSADVIGAEVFNACKSLKSVTFEEGCKVVTRKMFYQCSALETVSFPSTFVTIQEYGFYNCTKLNNVEFPESTQILRKSAFRNCTSLTSIEIPGNVNEVVESCFQGCTSLATVTLNTGTTILGNNAFRQTAVSEVYIPASVTTIGTNVFYGSTASNVTVHTEDSATAVIEYINKYSYLTRGENIGGSHTCTYGAWVETVAPTTTTTGLLTRTCECGEYETFVLPALNSTDYTVSTQEATCTATGLTTYSIVKDAQTFTYDVVIPATGNHVYGSYVVTTPATPFADGVETATCTCGATTTKTIKYTGKAYALDVVVNGTTATATLKLVGAPDLTALGVSIAYSNELTLTAATTTLSGNTTNPALANPVKFVWVNGLANASVNGDILTLTFTVASGATITADDFTITYDADDVCYVNGDALVNVALDTFVRVG